MVNGKATGNAYMRRVAVCSVCLLYLLFAGAATAQSFNVNTAPCRTLSVGRLADALNFTMLADFLDSAGLYNALNNTGFTAFFPTDAAFARFLNATRVDEDQLVEAEALLESMLATHVVLDDGYVGERLQNRTNVTLSEVLTTSNVKLNITKANPANITVVAPESRAMALLGASNGQFVRADCKKYVYPINNVLLGTGMTQQLRLLAQGRPSTLVASGLGRRKMLQPQIAT